MMNPEPGNQLNANRPQQTASVDDAPWWMKYVVRFIGSAGSLVALGLGAFACITVTPPCLMAGILQMLSAVVTILIEAPCFCMFLDFAQAPSKFFDARPYWHRAILYLMESIDQIDAYQLISLLPIFICRSVSIFCGSGLIFITGSLYGIMALGKKASVDEMRVKASSSYNLLPSPMPADVESGKQPSGTV